MIALMIVLLCNPRFNLLYLSVLFVNGCIAFTGVYLCVYLPFFSSIFLPQLETLIANHKRAQVDVPQTKSAKTQSKIPALTVTLYALFKTAGVERIATGKRSYEYYDKGSMLLLIVIELLSILGNEGIYSQFREKFGQQIDLQTSYPNWREDHQSLESSYFQGNVRNEMIVESGVVLPESLTDFVKQVLSRPQAEIPFRTDKVGFSFLRSLSVIFFHNDIFPSEWRSYMRSN